MRSLPILILTLLAHFVSGLLASIKHFLQTEGAVNRDQIAPELLKAAEAFPLGPTFTAGLILAIRSLASSARVIFVNPGMGLAVESLLGHLADVVGLLVQVPVSPVVPEVPIVPDPAPKADLPPLMFRTEQDQVKPLGRNPARVI